LRPHPADSQGARSDQPSLPGFTPPCGVERRRNRKWRWSREHRNASKDAARAGDRTDGERGDPSSRPLPTMGSRHPGCRRGRSLRGGAHAQGLGPQEDTAPLQGKPARARENLRARNLRETTRGVRGDSKEGPLPAGIAEKNLHSGPAAHVARRAIPRALR
jgi:hypothetical protein